MILLKVFSSRTSALGTFSWNFSTNKFKWLPPLAPKKLKDTAEKAVAAFASMWMISYSNQSDFFSENFPKTDNFRIQHHSSMGSRVLQLLNSLEIEENNKTQIIQAFTPKKGIKLNNHTNIHLNQNLRYAIDKSGLVFFPTFLATEIVKQVSGLRDSITINLGTRFMRGQYGIGKSMTQIMLSYLTTLRKITNLQVFQKEVIDHPQTRFYGMKFRSNTGFYALKRRLNSLERVSCPQLDLSKKLKSVLSEQRQSQFIVKVFFSQVCQS